MRRNALSVAIILMVWLGIFPRVLYRAALADEPASAIPSDNPDRPAAPVKLVFIHHSVGDAWLETSDGGLGNQLGANNYYVSDTYYDWGPDEIGSLTDIGNWWEWFRGPRSGVYTQAVYQTSDRHASYTRPFPDPGSENAIIMFKSCYPNSHLGGKTVDPPTTGPNPLQAEDSSSEHHTVGNAKGIYADLLAYFGEHQDKLFIAITAPPLSQAGTDAMHAANARALNDWLVHEWLDGYPHNNVAVFDLYNVLTSNDGDHYTNDLGAEAGNHHRWWNGTVQHTQTVQHDYSAYTSEGDSHPNSAGNQKATGEFVPWLNAQYNRWQGGTGEPTSTHTPRPTASSGAIRLWLPLILKVVPPTVVPTCTPDTLPTATQPPADDECPSYPSELRLITDLTVRPMEAMAEPSPRQWFRDPTFGTCLVRVTDRDNDPAPDDTSSGMANEYARVQAFNADSTRLLVFGTDGAWYLYDAHALTPLKQLPVDDEPRWDATDPDVLYFHADTRLLSYHVQTETERELRDFASDFPGQSVASVWTNHEGSPSADTRYWGLMAEGDDWIPVAFLVYDRVMNEVEIRDLRGVAGVDDDVDHVTMSTLGSYLLASFDRACEEGQMGSADAPCGLMVYDRDLDRARGLLRIIGHYDTALDVQGREVILYQDIDTDHISMLDLGSGVVTPLWEIDFAQQLSLGLHFSGVAYDFSGWAIVSTHTDDATIHTWLEDQVLLVELKPNGRVVRVAHTHSIVDEDQPVDFRYWAEPHASVSRDLNRILFTTNWGRYNTGLVEMYMISLPSDWIQRLN